MIYITAVRMSGGILHDHIIRYQWRDPSSSQTGASDRPSMVDWVENGGDARVRDGAREVGVRVVNAEPKYLRTYADGVVTDNLLRLPRF